MITNTLYNDDCLTVMQGMPDKCVDLVITDPPYGINVGGAKPFGKIGGANCIEPTEYLLFEDRTPPTKEYFDEMIRISNDQIIFGGNYFADLLPPTSCWIVWDKDNTGNFADAELAWTSFDTAVRIFKYRWNGMLQEDMAHKEIRVHPTQKPVKLFEWIIRNYAKEGDIICDPFFGSGSCLVAAVRLGHPFIGIEKEKVYFDKAKIRIEKAQQQGKLTSWGLAEV
jgi:site-specific DNA-methyltransferase (adenine-specific)